MHNYVPHLSSKGFWQSLFLGNTKLHRKKTLNIYIYIIYIYGFNDNNIIYMYIPDI